MAGGNTIGQGDVPVPPLPSLPPAAATAPPAATSAVGKPFSATIGLPAPLIGQAAASAIAGTSRAPTTVAIVKGSKASAVTVSPTAQKTNKIAAFLLGITQWWDSLSWVKSNREDAAVKLLDKFLDAKHEDPDLLNADEKAALTSFVSKYGITPRLQSTLDRMLRGSPAQIAMAANLWHTLDAVVFYMHRPEREGLQSNAKLHEALRALEKVANEAKDTAPFRALTGAISATHLKPYSQITTIVDSRKIVKFLEARIQALNFGPLKNDEKEKLNNILGTKANADFFLNRLAILPEELAKPFLLAIPQDRAAELLKDFPQLAALRVIAQKEVKAERNVMTNVLSWGQIRPNNPLSQNDAQTLDAFFKSEAYKGTVLMQLEKLAADPKTRIFVAKVLIQVPSLKTLLTKEHVAMNAIVASHPTQEAREREAVNILNNLRLNIKSKKLTPSEKQAIKDYFVLNDFLDAAIKILYDKDMFSDNSNINFDLLTTILPLIESNPAAIDKILSQLPPKDLLALLKHLVPATITGEEPDSCFRSTSLTTKVMTHLHSRLLTPLFKEHIREALEQEDVFKDIDITKYKRFITPAVQAQIENGEKTEFTAAEIAKFKAVSEKISGITDRILEKTLEIISSDNCPLEIIEFAQFYKKAVVAQFGEEKGKILIAQPLFLRFLSPIITETANNMGYRDLGLLIGAKLLRIASQDHRLIGGLTAQITNAVTRYTPPPDDSPPVSSELP